MISSIKQKNFFLKKCSTIATALENFCLTGDNEEIHRLRVEFKKVRALNSLIKECCKNSAIPAEFSNAKIVYRRAGIVRDAFISLQHAGVAGQDHAQAEFHRHASDEFCRRKELHIKILADWRDSVSDKFENISNGRISAYYSKWLNRLSDSFIMLDEDELHENRKIIKRLLYLYPLLNQKLKDSICLNTEYMDSLQEEIGKWHDTLIAREHETGSSAGNLKRIQKESKARLNSIRMLTDNFSKKYALYKVILS